MFLLFQMLLHTEYTAKLYLKTVTMMYEVYIFRFIHLPLDRASARCSHPGVLLCLGQVQVQEDTAQAVFATVQVQLVNN